ncbi:MAG: DUF4325 domain-containing protein [Cytophagales bacterium]|nr:MAG: DUF4325 domain-containing protein [Cytophagales bacterium]TAH28313.1 MAG: DUF4325 domain-containing protein [Cytophagales bacterium]
MKTIKIIEVIGTSSASLHTFGERVFEAVKAEIDNNEKVVLSFEGLTALTTGFLNASIGNLYFVFGDKLRDNFELQGVDKPKWQEKIQDAITLGTDKELSKLHQETWDLATSY